MKAFIETVNEDLEDQENAQSFHWDFENRSPRALLVKVGVPPLKKCLLQKIGVPAPKMGLQNCESAVS